MANPCFFFDLIRLTRKGRITLLRIAYTSMLLLALWLLHHRFVFDNYNSPARFALWEGGRNPFCT